MSRFFMICFDVTDRNRLRRIANELENFGQRVQLSLFECHLDDNQLFELKRRLAVHVDPQKDTIRYYGLCPKDIQDIQLDGPGEVSEDVDFTLC